MNLTTPLSTEEVIKIADNYLLKNVSRIPLTFVKGEGLKLYDPEGKIYLDFIGGIATCAFGHAPAFMAEVLKEQALKLVHVSNLFYNEPMVRLAEFLCQKSGLDRAFFSNSGAEANEAALKMARKYAIDRHGKNRYKIISAQNSFHGRTFGAISVTGQPNLQKGFEPLVPGIIFVPFGDLAALDKVLDDSIAGVILEPIQGEGGVRLPPEKYLHQAATLIRERGAVLILDEIQSGLGRTGKDFAFRHFDVEPDILTLGKALGCGYPIAATLAKEEPASALGPGTHSTTLGGAPLAMTLALELTQRILDPDFLDRVTQKGLYFQENLSRLKERFPKIVAQIRGLGLFLALELTIPAAPVMVSLREKGFLVNITNVNTLRLVPPLIVSHEEIDLLDKALRETLAETKTP